ncbi:tyrosine-type recombinase/integrase [Paenibacillus lutimineralis]|uniref:Site-specific integrase n=1 Tax=Paenibacillus lutimineralis TaxID=2707005 RepID=A0A3Q9IBL5_9BACL|nr:site-specific integrase [Paenibacillus lutimineralis]AZS14563.1 site-specific integrase [Paenibacillus lutimineralis]
MANIRQRGKNSYEFTVSTGKGPNNKYGRETTTIEVTEKMSPKKLQEYLEYEYAKFKEEVKSGNYIKPSKKTFEEFIPMWKTHYAISKLSPTTLETYEAHINSRLIPAFGYMQLDQIKPGHILDFLKQLESPEARLNKPKHNNENEESPVEVSALDFETIGYIYRVLKNIFSRATDWKMILSNPMEGIKKPTAPIEIRKQKQLEQKNNPQYYNEKEAQDVVEALYSESLKWRLFILGSMLGGFRRGELVALEWPQVSFEENSFSIENNIPLTKKGKAIEKDPKSLSSIRSVDMPEWYMEEMQLYLQEWEEEKELLGDKWAGEDRRFVFHNGKGEAYYYKHPSRWWERFCKRHNLRYIKFHGLRHSMGTLLIEDEDESMIDPLLIAIQKRLGHSRLSTTSDIYVHVTKKVRKKTTAKFEKFSRKNIVSPEPSPDTTE